MSAKKNFRDALGRLAQLGQATGSQLVRITEHLAGNRYTAQAIEFDQSQDIQPTGAADIIVINLAEPADLDGQLEAETNAVATDVEGRWVILVKPTDEGVFAGKVISRYDDALYRIQPQVPVTENTFANKSGSSVINACNLAELDMVSPPSVDANSIVLVTALATESDPPTTRYVFDHPISQIV